MDDNKGPDILNFQISNKTSQFIKVIGVGGGGGNAVNHMFKQGICDVDFILCNTDLQALHESPVPVKVQLGASLTEGRGAGNKPEIGKKAANENIEDVKKVLHQNTKMVFITAGMGGGTGTGAAPVIAEACRQLNLLTVGIVTLPFRNEGRRRIKQAIEGITELEGKVDSLLVINNERIREMYGDFPISQAFSKADNILTTAAKGIAEIITVPGYINVDFADVETVMQNSGVAVMGTGIAQGEGRALKAVELALLSPLLNNNNIKGAKNILLNVTSGKSEITMDEIGEITDYIQDKAGNGADIIWGNGKDDLLGSDISVTVIATGFSMSSIPEVLTTKEIEKVKLILDDDPPVKNSNISKKDQNKVNPEQKTFEFDITAQKESGNKYDVLYQGTNLYNKNQKNKERQKIDYAGLNDDAIDELEKIPAYQRKQMRMKGIDSGNNSDVSDVTVSKDEKNKLIFRKDNSYIHNRPD